MTSPANSDAVTLERPVAQGVTTHGRRFCFVWFTVVLVLTALVGAVDALIDPYLVIGAPRIAGLNAVKPESETHTKLVKDYLIARVQPAGLLLGDSKVDIGLDPDSPSWPEDAKPVFNYGIPGTGVRDALINLRRAIELGTISRGLVLIELEEFMTPADTTIAQPPGPAATTLSGLQGIGQHANDVLLATLSLDALRASVVTVAAQGRRDVADISFAGASSEGGFRGVVAADGYDALFLQKDSYLTKRMKRLAEALRARPEAGLGSLDAVTDMIVLCRQQGIALDLAIAPFHADFLEALDHAGLWPRYEQAKKELTRLVAAEGGNTARLWDFIGYDAYSTELVPGPSDRGGSMRTRWFWEPSHFKRVLGEKILATIYRGGADYGVRLTPDMIGAHLEAETQAKIAYQVRDSSSRQRLARAAR
jgi:hypothetical protein